MIDMLTEDAVNTACLGFDHQKLQLETNSSHSATLILNIEDAKGPDWMVSIASGSWKRICINLVSNALKYTPHGYINVTLRKKPLQRKAGMLVEFVVEDSGEATSNGVSEENWSKAPRRLGLGCLKSFLENLTRTLHATSTVSTQWSARLQRPAVRINQPLKATPTLVPRRCFPADPSQSLRRTRFGST